MVGRILLIGLLLLCQTAKAQEEQYIQPGLLAASLTYSPSTMLNRPINNFYISGFAEYFIDTKISFRSDSYLYRTESLTNIFMTDAFRSYFGVAYHMNKGNWDTHVGIQPGITIMNRKVFESQIEPSAALRVGTTYYVWKYFHFFANLTYVRSKVRVPDAGALDADELLFSAGLGFHIQTKRK
jgi:hypothetical protein